jgi:hypothetical protein
MEGTRLASMTVSTSTTLAVHMEVHFSAPVVIVRCLTVAVIREKSYKTWFLKLQQPSPHRVHPYSTSTMEGILILVSAIAVAGASVIPRETAETAETAATDASDTVTICTPICIPTNSPFTQAACNACCIGIGFVGGACGKNLGGM